MKKLGELLYDVPIAEIIGSDEIPISSICIDSRRCEQSSVFMAVKGGSLDGHNFIK